MFEARNLTTLILMGLFGVAALIATGFPLKGAFMPLIVAVPGLLLCTMQLVLDLRRRGAERHQAKLPAPAPAEHPILPDDEDEESDEIGMSELHMIGWLAAFALGIVGFGFLVGGTALVFLFVRFASRESWANAAFAAVGTLAVLFGVFVWLLGLTLFPGLVPGML